MKAVLQTIRILVIVLFSKAIRCQDGFSERDFLRLQQMASNDGQIDTITGYNNMLQRDPNSQIASASSVSAHYHMSDDTNKQEDYTRTDRGRSRKVYRIKNPFQRQSEDEPRQQENTGPQDSDNGASNQYAAMQYSLPPEEFLQQMRAENQYYQQQQPQVSTQAPNLGYTVTPPPQYQYSTIAASGYDNNTPQPNQIPQLEPKISQSQNYRSIASPYQYNNPNAYSFDSVQSTPSPVPPYLPTSSNNQYVGTPASAYVSSSISSPIFLSSPQNIQQYVSSPIVPVQTGTVEYKLTSTIGNPLSYETADKKMQIDHYDNSANGVRYQSQYQSEYPTSTPTPTSTSYSDNIRDSWQNAMNSNALTKSLQESSNSQYQKYPYNRYQQDGRVEQNSDNDPHRIGNMPSANNVYLNYMPPDYQTAQSLRGRIRDTEQEAGQMEYYSHGEYGWKLNDKKPLINNGYSGSGSSPYQRYQTAGGASGGNLPEGVAVSQMSFHMDTSNGKQHNYDHISKSSVETEAQEFAKAAAKAHENLKRQQYYGHEYSPNYNNNPVSPASANIYSNDKQRNKLYSESGNGYVYSSPQTDLITASPYFFANSRENSVEDKPKQPFDHDKALKNIVSIDVSNVVNSESQQQKQGQGADNSNRYSLSPYNKEQFEQNLKQNFKAIAESFYQDKNSIYGINIRPKTEEVPSQDGAKQLDSNIQFYAKQPEQYYTQNSPASTSYNPHQTSSYQDSIQSPANVQAQGMQRPQNPTDITSILKLNDIPYRITQNLPPETFRMNNNFEQSLVLPTPLPLRLNQNVGSHQLDAATNILNKLMLNKQPSFNRPELDPQSAGIISSINGFKVANPYNVDLRVVADMLKGKPAIDESHMLGLREQFGKPAPFRLDLSQLQQLFLKNENNPNISPINDALSAYGSPYFDFYNNGRFPYQGVKYSRSQEEEENIVAPIADASNNHPIGAVVEQDDAINGREIESGSDLNDQDENGVVSVNNYGDDRPKHVFSPAPRPINKHKHPNSIMSGRHPYSRKHPKADITEPYPLLKPPPAHLSRARSSHTKNEKNGRRRRVKRPRMLRIMKTEPLFEADSDYMGNDDAVPTLLRPPPPHAEEKSDTVDKDSTSHS